MDLWQRLVTAIRPHRPILIEPLETGHASAVARLHGEGGFSRGWDTGECAALIADRMVTGDGVFSGHPPQLAGFVLSRRAQDQAEILSIVMARTDRRAGHGRALLAAHLDRLSREGVRTLFLEVADGNQAAIGLYGAAGFVEVGRRNGYYPLPDGTRATARVLRRELA